jgi:hypothetical protein
MLSCDQCKAYKVVGQNECAICGFDPTKPPPEPEPTPEPSIADRAAVERKAIASAAREGSGGGATPFAVVGLIAVAVVGYLILSGSNIFGTGTNDSPPDALALELELEDVELGVWNDGSPIEGDDEPTRPDSEVAAALVAACRSEDRGVQAAASYRSTEGAHPVALVDLRFGKDWDPSARAASRLQRDVVGRTASPEELSDAEFVLCAMDAKEPGVSEVTCTIDQSVTDPVSGDKVAGDVGRQTLPLGGNDTTYKLLVAKTGRVVWEYSSVFPEQLAEQCTDPGQAAEWSTERLTIDAEMIWSGVSEWAIGRGPGLEPITDVDS